MKKGTTVETNEKYMKSAKDDDCWHGKTVVIDQIDPDNHVGADLWLPKGRTFRFTRNDNFCGAKGIRRYEIEFYTHDMAEVWKSCWLLWHPGHARESSEVLKTHPKSKPNPAIEHLVGFMPVIIFDKKAERHVAHVDRITMNYYRKGQAGEPTDRVYVYLEYADIASIREGGAASGPPH